MEDPEVEEHAPAGAANTTAGAPDVPAATATAPLEGTCPRIVTLLLKDMHIIHDIYSI